MTALHRLLQLHRVNPVGKFSLFVQSEDQVEQTGRSDSTNELYSSLTSNKTQKNGETIFRNSRWSRRKHCVCRISMVCPKHKDLSELGLLKKNLVEVYMEHNRPLNTIDTIGLCLCFGTIRIDHLSFESGLMPRNKVAF
ncbi:hypothetical protein WA026_009616 [Henosepilachna vigintioctopunctata]|uniref:Uncharacterized protein n=1 Tax=Henosepilachna vigintioctopunctata TaxID=420089 RepID=A0AAW1TW83_9CUCU